MPRHVSLAATVALVTLVAMLVLGWGLGGYVLYEPDEARHAEVAREMVSASTWREWVVPRLDGTPYLNKPAPFYWLMAAAIAALGVNQRAPRSAPLPPPLPTA